jgi:two-component system, OmpR family, phosphate regulon response regulator PhoB
VSIAPLHFWENIMAYILLVEDNQENADMTIRILQSAGHTVKHVIRGMDAMPLIRQEVPALILMDFDLPDVNGRVMALSINKQLGNNIPIVAVTARSGEAEARLAKRFGMTGFISKPFMPQDLLDVVAQYVPVKA